MGNCLLLGSTENDESEVLCDLMEGTILDII